jgi:proline iminopeptidase
MKYLIFLFTFFSMTLPSLAQDFPDSQTDGKYYEINGSRIWTISFGKGDPLFLIAGGPGNSHYH